MGVGNLSKIVGQLTKYGKDPQTPIALIRWGTRPEQQVVTGTLANIIEEVAKAKLTSPAIIIVGKVVTLRDTLSWFEQKPLFGKRILVTRAREQASVLSEKLEALGAEAWEYPTIEIKEPADSTALDQAIAEAGTYDWMIFTSANGVNAFFKCLKALKLDIRTLGAVKICAIGPKTKELLEDKGLQVAVMPEVFRAEAVAEALKPLVKAGEKVLLPRADIARDVLVTTLKEMGLEVNEVIAYETVVADTDDNFLIEKMEQKGIHIVTFTSSSTVRNFMKLIGERKELLDGVTIAAIGPVTAETAEKLGLKADIIADEYTIDGLVQALVKYYQK